MESASASSNARIETEFQSLNLQSFSKKIIPEDDDDLQESDIMDEVATSKMEEDPSITLKPNINLIVIGKFESFVDHAYTSRSRGRRKEYASRTSTISVGQSGPTNSTKVRIGIQTDGQGIVRICMDFG